MSSRRILTDSISHQVQLLRFAAKVGRNAQATLNAADDELLAFLGRRLRELLRATPNVQREMRGGISITVGEINAATYDEVAAVVLEDMADLMLYEAEFQAGMLSRMAGVDVGAELSRGARESILDAPIMGRTIAEQIEDAALARLQKIQAAIGNAIATDARAQEALDLVEGTAEAGFSDGALEAGRRWLDTLASTDTVAVADATGREVYAESDVVEGELWVSVLDSATTPVCRANDGARRKLGEREWRRVDGGTYTGPYPAHWNERSIILPELEGAEPVDKITYGEWLSGESEATQRETLGDTRFRLWKAGRLPLGRFTTDRGRPLTIKQLRELEADAFKRAGLEDAA